MNQRIRITACGTKLALALLQQVFHKSQLKLQGGTKIEPYILSTDYLKIDKNNVVACSTIGTYNQPQVTNKWVKSPVMAFLIDTGDGHTLYDAGNNPKAMDGYRSRNLQEVYPLYWKEEERLENQLVLVGIRPEDIKTVTVSHMHLDHAGNLHLFPYADVYVSKADFLNAQVQVRLSPGPTMHGGYVKGGMNVSVKQYHLVDSDFEPAPGVDVVNLPGHTPGLLGLVIYMENNTFIPSQDAVCTSETYGPPAKMPGLLYGDLTHFQSVQGVHDLEKKRNGKVVFAHDYEFLRTLKTAPHYYD